MTSNPPQSGVQQGQSTATSPSNPTNNTTTSSSNTSLAASTSASARSYANAATKKSATDATAAPVTVGGSAQHGKSTSSASPVNGNPMQTQQSQQANTSGVTIVNGAPTAPAAAASSAPQGDHSRKPSVTITSAGTSGYMPNGGSASRPQSLQFGFANPQSSPNMGNPAVLANNQSQPGLGAPSTNPRVTSPQTSPSPIPQPASSGGRPPPSTYQGQGNVPNFGSFGESGDNNVSCIFPLFSFPFFFQNLSSSFLSSKCGVRDDAWENAGTRPRWQKKKKKKKTLLESPHFNLLLT